jgi:hypothetical protein
LITTYFPPVKVFGVDGLVAMMTAGIVSGIQGAKMGIYLLIALLSAAAAVAAREPKKKKSL